MRSQRLAKPPCCGKSDGRRRLSSGPRRAMHLKSYHPNWYWLSVARGLHEAGHYGGGAGCVRRESQPPLFYHAYVAACYAELGQEGGGAAQRPWALQARPDFSVSAWGRGTYKNEVDLQRFLDGLRKAGLPE